MNQHFGGMGPASTLRFLDLVMSKYRSELGAIENSDFPQITLQTVPRSNHMAALPDRGILSSLSRSVALLEYARVSFFVSPCNTVHQFLIHFDCGGLPLLNIVDAVRVHGMHLLSEKRVLFLSTRQTLSSNIYDLLLEQTHAEVVLLSEGDQVKLDAVIASANAGGALDSLQPEFMRVLDGYEFDTVLLACTELSLFLPMEQYVCVDSLEALAQAAFLVSSGQGTLADYSPSSTIQEA
jgi:aspartate/glutamate racemase